MILLFIICDIGMRLRAFLTFTLCIHMILLGGKKLQTKDRFIRILNKEGKWACAHNKVQKLARGDTSTTKLNK